jgi:hypothetical protein
MRTGIKTAFRPSLERVEPRIVAAGGAVSAAAHHGTPHPSVHVAPHHQAKHPAAHPSATASRSPAPPPAHPAPPPSLPRDTTTDQAWVELENMTGEDLSYQIKLGPYADGKFLPFDIGAGATEFQFSSLISGGKRVDADFAIQFGNGPVTPLMTGISQSSSQGYYIFLDDNLQPYVAPFIKS